MRRIRSLAAGIALVALVATGCGWQIEVVDGAGGGGGRTTADVGSDVAMVGSHAFYYDATNGNLRHAYYTVAGWQHEVLDGAGGSNGRIDADVGSGVSGMFDDTTLRVFYYDATNGNLRQGYFAGGVWHFETIDGQGGAGGRVDADVGMENTATTQLRMIDPLDPWSVERVLNVYYPDSENGDLRLATYSEGAWDFETLDGAGGSNGRIDADVGESVSVLDELFTFHWEVFYYDATNGDLRYGRYDIGTGTWEFRTLDGSGGGSGRVDGDVGSDVSATSHSSGPAVFYYDATNGNLRSATWNGSDFVLTTLDGAGGGAGRISSDVGSAPDVVFSGFSDEPLRVFYYDAGNRDLRVGVHNGGPSLKSGWTFEAVDGRLGNIGATTNDVGSNSAGALIQRPGDYIDWGPQDPHVLYYDRTKGELRHAWKGCKIGGCAG
ncbi:MAG: hypothetical protein M5U31_04215 [Acidimicrobiia bacterium]|nr:hypothetical protein [Acidimicrobiia bacterium]